MLMWPLCCLALWCLQSLEELHSSRSALQLLLDGQDYAGALDLLEEVAHNMEASCAQRITTFASVMPEVRARTQRTQHRAS